MGRVENFHFYSKLGSADKLNWAENLEFWLLLALTQGRRMGYGRYGLHHTRFFSPNAFHGQSGEISFEFQQYI